MYYKNIVVKGVWPLNDLNILAKVYVRFGLEPQVRCFVNFWYTFCNCSPVHAGLGNTFGCHLEVKIKQNSKENCTKNVKNGDEMMCD